MADTIDITGPPAAGTETLLGGLERQRAYLAWKCGGIIRESVDGLVGEDPQVDEAP